MARAALWSRYHGLVSGPEYLDVLRIGLTGGIASGKSTVASLFAALGAGIIDTDEVARDVVAPGQPGLAAVVERFGTGVLAGDGTLDRRRVRQLIFEDPVNRHDLESILHPRIRAETLRRAGLSTAPYVIVVVPLMFETGFDELVDRKLVVDCTEDEQLQRLLDREQIPVELARAMIDSQIGRMERLTRADDVIDNSGAADGLRTAVESLHRRYLAMAQNCSPPAPRAE